MGEVGCFRVLPFLLFNQIGPSHVSIISIFLCICKLMTMTSWLLLLQGLRGEERGEERTGENERKEEDVCVCVCVWIQATVCGVTPKTTNDQKYNIKASPKAKQKKKRTTN